MVEHEPLSDEQLALVKRYATVMIDDERVASYALRLLSEHEALKRERVLLRAVARDAAAYARSKHASYWQQTSGSLEALAAFDAERERKGAGGG